MLVIIKRRHLKWIFLSILAVTAGVMGILINPVIPTHTPLRTFRIAIDPGHGGVDGGCGQGVWQEKHINLAVGLALRDFLRQSGLRTALTRSKDTALETDLRPGRHRRDLSRRVHHFKRASLFISIHCDWSPDTRRSGPAVFYRYSRKDCKSLATTVQNELNAWAGIKRRAEPGNYFILKNSTPPGIIVEAGFLSNPADRSHLQDPKYRASLAAAIGRGVLGYIRTAP